MLSVIHMLFLIISSHIAYSREIGLSYSLSRCSVCLQRLSVCLGSRITLLFK